MSELYIFRIMEHIEWQPGIGDPTFTGWLIVFAYACCFTCCCLCFLKNLLNKKYRFKNLLFWFCAAAAMLMLGINKQLDLQTLLTQLGRAIAKEQGWYETRRNFQLWFVTFIAIGGIVTTTGLFHFLRPLFSRLWSGFLGLSLLCIFVIIRAASFHKIDRMLGLKLLGLKINPLIELSGILLILFCALKELRGSQRKKHSPGKQAIYAEELPPVRSR